MANNLDASFPEYWSRRMQRKYYKSKVFKMISSMEEQKLLENGDVVNRPYRSDMTYNTMGSEGSYTRQDITDTNESLTINVEPETSFYVKEVDEIQSNYKTANEYADDAADVIGDKIDGDILGEYDQANSVVGNYEIAGTGTSGDGIGFAASTSNIFKVFGIANKKLTSQNIALQNRWAIISPEFYQTLWEFLQGKDSNLGDKVGVDGKVGTYAGFELYLSNNTGWSGRLEFATNPTEADTITINAVAFNFKATLGTVAGTIHICSDAENTLNQLVSAVNTPGTSVASATDAGFVAVSAANQILLKSIVATDGATYMTLKAESKSYVAVSETLSAEADIWTTTKQIQHQLFGQNKPVDLVIQKYPNLRIKDRDGYIGKDFVTWTLYGLKTFAEGSKQLVDVQTRSDGY